MQPAVYSYTRFSDPRQGAGQSSERQNDLAAKWAASRGLVLDASLSMHDEGLSAYHQRHVKTGALGVFLAAVQAGRIPVGSFLIVEQLDRLSRAEPQVAQAQLTQIIMAGITVVTTKDKKEYSRKGFKENSMDLVMSLLVMIRAHEESERKSQLVTASIRILCERWQAGTYRGIIRNGTDPAWLKRVGDQWEFVPERVAAVQTAIDLYRQGYGACAILNEVRRLGLKFTKGGGAVEHVYRLVRQHALVGDREFRVDGEHFILAGYFPALLSRVEWNELQALADDRSVTRRGGRLSPVPGQFVHFLSGVGVLRCGYCDSAVNGQIINRNRMPDGRLRDYCRRMRCVGYQLAKGCPVPGTCSIAPVERAVMSYCSDMINLQALYGQDRTSAPRTKIANARAAIADINQKLERLTDAMLAADKGSAPATFVKRAKELEGKKAHEQAALAAAERALASTARTSITSLDDKWRALAAGVENQEAPARMKARQLVADTFERITVYHRGVIPEETPKGTMDVVLLAKGGVERLLRIDAEGWTAIDHFDGGAPDAEKAPAKKKAPARRTRERVAA